MSEMGKTNEYVKDQLYDLLRKAADFCTEQEHIGYWMAADYALNRMSEIVPFAPILSHNKVYCGWCGRRIPKKIKARYCHKCGKRIDWKGMKEI